MRDLNQLADTLPEAARDTKLNLQTLLGAGAAPALSPQQKWLVAGAAALASRNRRLATAVLAAARAEVGQPVVDDAVAAATLMAMNNVFYRFRHQIEKPVYSEKPARLRMQRLLRPATTKVDFELACLAVSAINGCQACVQAHEQTVLEAGLTPDHVFDAVRVAAAVHAAAVGLDSVDVLAASSVATVAA